MSKVKYIFEKNIFEMIYEDTDIIENVLEKYIKILLIEKKDLLFLYKGINILKNKDIFNKLKNNNKNNIIITVIKKNKSKNKNDIENIICPECQKLAFLNINDDNIIKIDNCINKHKNEYSINEFIENQNIKENEIKCDICKNNKYLYNDNFYKCSCTKNICQLCMINHIKNKEHNLLYYNKRYFNCNKHLIEYISYCSNCNLNLCKICEKEHYNHRNKIILYKKEKIDERRKKEIEKEFKENISKINEYKNEINQINDSFDNVIKNISEELDNYNKLYNKMIIILHNLNNYQNIKNIVNYKNMNIIKEISKFLKENIKNRLKYFADKYIVYAIYASESTLIYKMDDKKVRLFGNEFVKNNKDNYYLIIENKKINLCEFYNLKYESKNNYLKVKLIQKIMLLI